MGMKRVIVDGKTLNYRTAQMLKRAEERLGESLYVVQGSYSSGVSQSAGTHDGGGAIDVSPTNDPNRVVRELREVGFAAWHRTADQGDWNAHIHAIAIGDSESSSGARQQVQAYYSGRNGLASNAQDDGPRLDPIPVWPVELPRVSLGRVVNQFEAKTPRKTQGVERVQKLLNRRLNLNISVDGVAGDETRNAYKKWQKENNSSVVDGLPREPGVKLLLAGFYRLVK